MTSGGPTDRGGLERGDVIVGSGGRRLSGIDDLLALLTEETIGAVVTLRVLRGEQERIVMAISEIQSWIILDHSDNDAVISMQVLNSRRRVVL